MASVVSTAISPVVEELAEAEAVTVLVEEQAGLQLLAQFWSIHVADTPVHCPCDAQVAHVACESVPEHEVVVVGRRGAAVAMEKVLTETGRQVPIRSKAFHFGLSGRRFLLKQNNNNEKPRETSATRETAATETAAATLGRRPRRPK